MTKPKPVTLFRRPGKIEGPHIRFDGGRCGVHPSYPDRKGNAHWFGAGPGLATGRFKSPHAAARALERKIESQWKRLGKMMGKAK